MPAGSSVIWSRTASFVRYLLGFAVIDTLPFMAVQIRSGNCLRLKLKSRP